MESQIEKVINQVTSSDLFLRTVSTLINFNSYRKIWLQNTLEKIVKLMELPARRDQERLLALVQELEIRIKKLQLAEEMKALENQSVLPQVVSKKVFKSKKAMGKRIN